MRLYAQVGALIVATSLVHLANGFFTTLVALRLGVEDFNPAVEGIVMSAYFVGFTMGSLSCNGIIQRIGHIRGYAAFGSIVIGATVGMGLVVDAVAWAVLRAAIGFGCVGLFVATESWLNAKATPALRGKIFSTYMVGTFLALALGQLLVGRLPLEGGEAFNVIVALFAVALLIVSLTRAEQPVVAKEAASPFGDLLRGSPIAVFGSAIGGMISATFYAVVPSWMLANRIPQETIGLVMLSAVLGGLAFQVPVGWLSDRMDRRMLVGALAFGIAGAAVILVLMPSRLSVALPLAALLGGFMSTLYPVCVSHAMDNMGPQRAVSISGQLILVSGLGSTVGPLTGAWIMSYLDLDGVLYFMASAAVLLGSVTIVRTLSRPSAPLAGVPPSTGAAFRVGDSNGAASAALRFPANP